MTVPIDARSAIVWFESTSVSGCHMWDSNYGNNYVFAAATPPQWVGNGDVLFYHEQAFANEAATIEALRRALGTTGTSLRAVRVDTGFVSVADAVASYLFNSQLLSKPDGGMALVVPHECR